MSDVTDLARWSPQVHDGRVVEDETVVGATRRSLAATRAVHTPADDAARATLLVLAAQIDYAHAHGGLTASGKLDNTTIPTFLRYAESLGLTPAGRARAEEATGGRDAGKLGHLRGQRPTG